MRFQPEQKWWAGAKFPPRQWQAAALPKAVEAVRAQGEGEAPAPVIRAVMGAGKSHLIAELIKQCAPERHERIVVTAPTQKLVRQLSATIVQRVGGYSVGQFYAKRKDVNRPVIVACMDSAGKLAQALGRLDKEVALLISDECHRTEAEGFLEAVESLAPVRRLGFTATPWRSESNSGLSLWDALIHDYGPAEAIRDGVVVPWKLVTGWPEDIPIDEVCLEMITSAVEDDLGPGVVNAISVEDAEGFADILRAAGVRAQAIHYQLGDEEQDRLLRHLEIGRLDCLVHVALLQEGVDMPWLRWGCLRRNVQSTVRFPQEVGRFLRAHPGKDHAVIFDPRDLFETMDLDLEAVLSGDIEPEDKPPITLALEEVEDAIEAEEAGETRVVSGNAAVVDAMGRYIRQLVVSFDLAGIIDRRKGSRSWRKHTITPKQVKAIWKMKWVLNSAFIPGIPWKHRRALAWCVEYRSFLNKGQASDLLDLMYGLKHVKRWPELADRMADASAVA